MITQGAEASPEGLEAMNSLTQLVLSNPAMLRDSEVERINTAVEKGTLEDTAMVLMRDPEFVRRLSQYEKPETPTFEMLAP